MRNHFPLLQMFMALSIMFTLLAMNMTPTIVLLAQETTPTPLPAPAHDELIVVAGGHGAALYASDGTYLEQLAAGARLIANRQSADQAWLAVTTSDGQSGWAMREDLIVFERMPLPTVDITIVPVAPSTPEPILPADTANQNAGEQTRDEQAIDEQVMEGQTSDLVGSAEVAAVADNVTEAPTNRVGGPTVEALVRTDGLRLNIRSGPGTNYPVIAKAASGETLTVVARNRDQQWLQVARADAIDPIGWVATQYVAVAEPLAGLAVAEGSENDGVLAGDADAASIADATTTAAQSTTGPAGLGGKLVFTDRNGGTIYLYNLATGQLANLTTGLDPALSPNGQEIVFTRPAGNNGIYLINVDGSNERQIFAGRELLRSPKWSPDGRYIVFSRGDEFNRCYLNEETGECLRRNPFFTEGLEQGRDHIYKLARVDRNGENYRDIAVVPQALTPDWSRDGIVYRSGSGLQITQDTPEDQNRLLYFDIKLQYHQDPDWQPNGNRIVYQQRQGGHYEIFAINADGSGRTALTRPVTTLVDQLPSNVTPAWSPDGQSIVFLSNRTADHEAGPWRLWVMNGDGSNQRPLPINVDLHYDYASEQMVDWGP